MREIIIVLLMVTLALLIAPLPMMLWALVGELEMAVNIERADKLLKDYHARNP